jgi:hypothetical protein
MFIQTESTPNPATLKFLPGQTVLDMGTADFPSAETAGKSPLATRIFATGGVAGVFLGMDFITVTKAETSDWQHIKPAILGAIMEHYQSGAAVMEGEQAAHKVHEGPDGDVVRQIMELLDTRVRPAVAQDGGESEIVVTGSLIAGTPEDAALPVDVIGEAELARQGNPSTLDLVKALPSPLRRLCLPIRKGTLRSFCFVFRD